MTAGVRDLLRGDRGIEAAARALVAYHGLDWDLIGRRNQAVARERAEVTVAAWLEHRGVEPEGAQR